MMTGKPNSLREGIRLGFAVATSIWIWLALVDAIAGEPFRTFQVLGGIPSFTVMHYVLNIAYGTMIVAVLNGALRQPTLIGAVTMGFLMIEFGFAMITVLLSHVGLGGLAWLRVFGGSVIGAAVAFMILRRRYPLEAMLRHAEDEEAKA
jgi:hypothetical protein